MRTIFGAVIMLAVLSSCSKESPQAETVTGTGGTGVVPFGVGGSDASSINLYRERFRTISGTHEHARVEAFFRHDDSINQVSAGTLVVNGVAIAPSFLQGGTYYQQGSVPLVFNGSYQTFATSGAAGFPSMVDSVPAPMGDLVVASPAPTDTVTKAGFTITWNQSAAMGVIVRVSDTSATTRRYVRFFSGDPGSVALSASDLADFHLGPIQIDVIRGNYKSAQTSSGRRYVIGVYSQELISIRLRP